MGLKGIFQISHRSIYRQHTRTRKISPVCSAPFSLTAQPVDSHNFGAFGQAVTWQEDGIPFSSKQEAQLELSNGIPRFYIMRLRNDSGLLSFSEMNYHAKSSQLLGSNSDQDWFLAVARATFAEEIFPAKEDIRVFRIPGQTVVNLNKGTWHAGPLFKEDVRDFLNLELVDTNISDRYSHIYDVHFIIE